jgi:hypothetical protein
MPVILSDLPHRYDFTPIKWAEFKACLEDRLPQIHGK